MDGPPPMALLRAPSPLRSRDLHQGARRFPDRPAQLPQARPLPSGLTQGNRSTEQVGPVYLQTVPQHQRDQRSGRHRCSLRLAS
ncbi:hypothetical protein NDU88_003537 [Pleurodeles waltl]|uniref:Uncharacterized protein n=1 Tax=Pleurodeles waltl TaxID=8319 RepID=A0AAV7T589_PLEWA|nr:hypothetical protein NDU88_003537 [Pleurodeles waltl]